jgi:hypothetical protein
VASPLLSVTSTGWIRWIGVPESSKEGQVDEAAKSGTNGYVGCFSAPVKRPVIAEDNENR